MNTLNLTDQVQKYLNPKYILSDFCSMPSKTLSYIQEYYVQHNSYRSLTEITEDLIEDYQKAIEQTAFKIIDDRILFRSFTRTEPAECIEISIKQSTFGEYPMFLHFIKFQKQQISSEPSKSLEQFAFLGSWQSFLSDLASKAMPEDWNFSEVDKSYPVLCQYIKYTFYRLQCENKIYISPDRSLAAFNTGLHSIHYEPIYACFIPNATPGGSPWRFAEFAIAGARTYGKLLLSCFESLPSAAEYVTRLDQIMIMPNKSVMVDYDHVILDNIIRYPKEYLKSLTEKAEFHQLIDAEDADSLSAYLSADRNLFNRIRGDISAELTNSLTKAIYDYRLAIPCYFPKGNRVTLMLPLYLLSRTSPDLALVVELTSAGNYQGQTVLTLSQAYSDARVISELSDTWLGRLEDDFDSCK